MPHGDVQAKKKLIGSAKRSMILIGRVRMIGMITEMGIGIKFQVLIRMRSGFGRRIKTNFPSSVENNFVQVRTFLTFAFCVMIATNRHVRSPS